METIAKIRRRYEVNGESIRSIARALKLSRNTVNQRKRFTARLGKRESAQACPRDL